LSWFEKSASNISFFFRDRSVELSVVTQASQIAPVAVSFSPTSEDRAKTAIPRVTGECSKLLPHKNRSSDSGFASAHRFIEL